MKKMYDQSPSCPCHSGQLYETCCQPFHLGNKASTALQLMRARYSAYSLSIPEFIIFTTHPANPQFCHELTNIEWAQKISAYSLCTQFKGLEILNFEENGSLAMVIFSVHLLQDKQVISYTEKSYFEKVRGEWLFLIGQTFQGTIQKSTISSKLGLLPIAYYGNSILHKVADPVLCITSDIRKLVGQMIETMDLFNGIGLAAPQVGRSIRLFIIRKPREVERGNIEFKEIKVFINPKISHLSNEVWEESEGCLSIPKVYAKIKRPKQLTIEYLNLNGNLLKEKILGWEARIILHENDHLNGMLFIDHLNEEAKKSIQPVLSNWYNRIHDGV